MSNLSVGFVSIAVNANRFAVQNREVFLDRSESFFTLQSLDRLSLPSLWGGAGNPSWSALLHDVDSTNESSAD